MVLRLGEKGMKGISKEGQSMAVVGCRSHLHHILDQGLGNLRPGGQCNPSGFSTWLLEISPSYIPSSQPTFLSVIAHTKMCPWTQCLLLIWTGDREECVETSLMYLGAIYLHNCTYNCASGSTHQQHVPSGGGPGSNVALNLEKVPWSCFRWTNRLISLEQAAFVCTSDRDTSFFPNKGITP